MADKAFFVDEVACTDGNFSVRVAVRGEPGHHEWNEGWPSRAAAQAHADEKNRALGITADEAHDIVLSSMAAGPI